MAKIRCKCCGGSGKVMGGGMMYNDCDACDGVGKVYDHNAARIESVKKIQSLHPGMEYSEAEKVFDDELEKLDNGVSKNGKRNKAKD